MVGHAQDSRDLCVFRNLTSETGDRQNLVASAIAYRLYSKPCCRVLKNNLGTRRSTTTALATAFSMVNQ